MAPESGFTHRQTMAGAVRFNALALHEEASRIAEAGGHALGRRGSAFRGAGGRMRSLGEAHRPHRRRWRGSTFAAGQAERARKAAGPGPTLSRNLLEIVGGRHPVVEARWRAKGERFVANDCALAPTTGCG
jgi:DNA mismatch repair protein MutS